MINSILIIHSYVFQTAHCLLYDSETEAVKDPRAEAAGEQGGIMIPCSLIEKAMAGYFAVSEESGGDAADVGPSSAGTSKRSLVASSSFGWTTEGSASEGEPAVRVDSVKDFPMDPERTESLLKDFRERLWPRQSR